MSFLEVSSYQQLETYGHCDIPRQALRAPGSSDYP